MSRFSNREGCEAVVVISVVLTLIASLAKCTFRVVAAARAVHECTVRRPNSSKGVPQHGSLRQYGKHSVFPDTVASCATPALPVFQTIDAFLLFDYRGLSSGTQNGKLNRTLSPHFSIYGCITPVLTVGEPMPVHPY